MNRIPTNRALIRILVFCLAGVSWPVAAAAQAVDSRLERVESRFDEARGEAVNLLAPRAWEDAVDRLDEARRRVAGGGAAAEAVRRLDEAEARLEAAWRLARAARELFADGLAARDAAIEAEAGARAPDAWQEAEAAMRDAGRRHERDDRDGAAAGVGRAVTLYRRAAVAAWRARALGEAIQARQRALSVGAEALAPAAFDEGERALAIGEEAIRTDPRSESAAAAGARALAAYERAADVAALADSVLRRNVPVERVVRAHESDLAELAAPLGVEATPGRTDETTRRIATAIDRLQREAERLDRELADSREEAADLAARLADVEAELAQSERRFTETREELLTRRERDRRLREVSALFSPEEGEVFVADDRLTVRLYGLTFETGAYEILEEHQPLLTKVERVISAFQGARIRIEGHTDSRGDADRNQALSQRRAIAVREYLLTRLPIPSSRVDAVGLGESRPIASEESAEGLARNRRIEVVLELGAGAGG